MLTYFRGSSRGEEKLRGHNYENVMKYMEKLIKKLEKGGMGTVRQSFLLGKLVHYVNKMISSDNVNLDSIDDGIDIVEYLEGIHYRYVNETPGCENDYRHIIHAISVVTERLWQTESVSMPSMRDVAIACKKCIPVTENANMAAGNTGMETTRVA